MFLKNVMLIFFGFYCIVATYRTRQEIQCLPNAEYFFKEKLRYFFFLSSIQTDQINLRTKNLVGKEKTLLDHIRTIKGGYIFSLKALDSPPHSLHLPGYAWIKSAFLRACLSNLGNPRIQQENLAAQILSLSVQN